MSPASNLVDLWGLALSTCCFTVCEFTPAGTHSRLRLFIPDCGCPQTLELCKRQILLTWKMGDLLTPPPLALAWWAQKRIVKYSHSQKGLSGDVLVAASKWLINPRQTCWASGIEQECDTSGSLLLLLDTESCLPFLHFPSNLNFYYYYLFAYFIYKGISKQSAEEMFSLWSVTFKGALLEGSVCSLLHSLIQAKQAQGVV